MEEKLQISYQQFQRKYQIESQIGRGGFGMVCRIYNPRTKCCRALKTIRCCTFDQIQAAEQEIQIMAQLQHPRFLKLFEFYTTCYRSSVKGETTYFGMVLQLGQKSLQQSLRDPQYHYSLSDARRFLAKLIEVGAFLQSKELVHCDIKPANIIIFGPGLDFKVADFGLSCNAGRRPNAFVGSPHYCSPKLQEFYYNPKSFSKKPLTNAFKDDVYSVGLTVNEVLLKLNFDYKNQDCRSRSQDLCTILEQMLRVEEKYRPTFKELMENQFMRRQLNSESTTKQVDEDEHFKKIVLKEEVRSQKSMLTIKKEPNMRQTNSLVSQQHFKLQHSIRAVLVVSQRYLLAGTDHGLLVVHDTKSDRTIVLSLKHKDYVSCIAGDASGNIYSAGGDGVIYCFSKAQLIELLQSKVETKYVYTSCLYAQTKKTESYELRMEGEHYETILNGLEKKHISHLYCLERERIAVGYADGSVVVLWEKKCCQFENYHGVVTSIRHFRQTLFVSFYSGNIVQFNLKQLKKDYAIRKFSDTVIDFNVGPFRQGYALEVFTYAGNIQKLEIDQSGKTVLHLQNTMKHLVAVDLSQDEVFMLSEDGVLLHDSEEFMSEVGEGWCCLAREKGVLVMGGFAGDLAVLRIAKNN